MGAAGWRPVSDASAIALRSWDILTAYAPLVGQATRLGQGIFDPGPLEYWLLAVAAADQRIRHQLSARPIALTISSPDMGYHKRRLLLGLAYVLTTQGYSPRISDFGSELGSAYVVRPGMRITVVRISVRPDGITITVAPRHPAG